MRKKTVKKKPTRKQASAEERKPIKFSRSTKRASLRLARLFVTVAIILTFFTLVELAIPHKTDVVFPLSSVIPMQNPDTRNWQTFADNRYGFTFEYPGDMYSVVDDNEQFHLQKDPTLPDDAQPDIRDVFLQTKGYEAPKPLYAIRVQSTDGENAVPFTLWVFDNKSALHVDEWYAKYDYYPLYFRVRVPSEVGADKPMQDVAIGGLFGKYHFLVDDVHGDTAFLYIPRADTMLLLAVSETAQQGNDILSTFRFFPNPPGK